MQTFGHNLQALRLNKGHSLEGLATLYNVTFDGHLNKSTLSRYENGLQVPRASVVKNLADILHVSCDHLLGINQTISREGGKIMTLRELRRRAGLTQQALADKLGVAQSTVAGWETGQRTAPVKEIRPLAEALGCSEQEVIYAVLASAQMSGNSGDLRPAAPEPESLWGEVGNLCLTRAKEILKRDTAPTAATVEAVKSLIDSAVSIDLLNLRWAEQTQSCAALFRGQPSPQRPEEN